MAVRVGQAEADGGQCRNPRRPAGLEAAQRGIIRPQPNHQFQGSGAIMPDEKRQCLVETGMRLSQGIQPARRHAGGKIQVGAAGDILRRFVEQGGDWGWRGAYPVERREQHRGSNRTETMQQGRVQAVA